MPFAAANPFDGLECELANFLGHQWAYNPWGGTGRPLTPVLGDDNRLWLGDASGVSGSGSGPNGEYGGIRVWNTQSEADTVKLLQGNPVTVCWDNNNCGSYSIGYPGPDQLTRTGGYFMNKIGTPGLQCPGVFGDPHLKSWTGEYFDYHGVCDLTLMHAPKFDGILDMDVQIRTQQRYDYSFVEAAALRIGDDILEVAAWGDYALNGVEGALTTQGGISTFGGYPVVHTQVNEKKHVYNVVIGEHTNITISSMKDWVNVAIFGAHPDQFGSISGLMGTWDGKLLARDGTDLRNDVNAFGSDWQVQPSEGNLFRSAREPQYPKQCVLPAKTTQAKRRLGEDLAKSAAEKACAHLTGKKFSFCVDDVIASGDLDMAAAGAF